MHSAHSYPYSALLVVSYCALHRKDSLCMLAHKLWVRRKGGTRRGTGRVTGRVLCTCQLLGLAVKGPWLPPGKPILILDA